MDQHKAYTLFSGTEKTLSVDNVSLLTGHFMINKHLVTMHEHTDPLCPVT